MSGFKTPNFVTYWPVTANDGFGGKTHSAGVKVAARIANRSEEIITEEGKTILTSNAIYTRIAIPPEAYIAEGDYEGDANPPSVAKRVMKHVKNSSMTDMHMVLI